MARPRPAVPAAALAGALALGCGAPLFDPNDCRLGAGPGCAPYRPAGLVCGAVHSGIPEAARTECAGRDPGQLTGADIRSACPPGFDRAGVADHEASSSIRYCAAAGNAAQSSAALAEVPAGAVCGWNTTQRGDFFSECSGFLPQLGECPPGFTLRAAIDNYADAGARGGHIIAWCELDTEVGCIGADCPPILPGTVCGLVGAATLSSFEPAQLEFVPGDEPHPGLLAALAAQGEAVGVGRCQGLDVALEGCPPGWVHRCLPDRAGSSAIGFTVHEAYCYCAWEG
jgi:hypothetical protein